MILRRKSKLRYVQQEKTRHGRITYYFRIDSSKGYEKGNVRIVVFAANVMMLDWGLDVFEKVSKEYNQNILCPHLETGCGE